MENNIGKILATMLSMRPDVVNNPQAMEALDAIKNGDSVKGEAIARAICRQKGETPESATGKASNWFNSLTSRRTS